MRSDSPQIHGEYAIALRCLFLAGSSEAVKVRDHTGLLESRGSKRRDKLCFQQSAGDSTGPEVDVSDHRFGQLPPDDDVGELHAAIRFQHSGNLVDGRSFPRNQIQHAVGDHDVDAMVLERQREVASPARTSTFERPQAAAPAVAHARIASIMSTPIA
jgi:hypothetical protein